MNINANYVPPAHMLHPNLDPVTQEEPTPVYKDYYQTFRVRVPAPQDRTFGDRHRSPIERTRTLERPGYERMTALWDNAQAWARNIGIYATVQHFNMMLHSRIDPDCSYSEPWEYAANKAAAYEILSPVARLVGYHLAVDNWNVHPAVMIALKEASPRSVRELFCQAPRRSREDGVGPGMVAYSKDYDALVRGGTTRTTVGRYLTRMFPTLSADRIRDISALVGAKRVFGITTDMDEMVDTLMDGPQTCMKNDYDIHPYRVYDPSLGWGLAYGETTESERSMHHWYGGCACRALVNTRTMKFVRTFGMASSPDSTSPDSDELRVWLLSQGYEKEDNWTGHDIKYIENCGDTVMPYIDGDDQRVYATTKRGILCIGRGNRFMGTADNTDGTLDGSNNEPDWTCSDCGSDQSDDDSGWWVGRHEEEKVCADCINEYRMVSGKNRHEYYVRTDCAVQVGDDWFDEDYLKDNDIVQCAETGDNVHTDDTFYCGWHDAEVDNEVDSTHVKDEYGQDGEVCTAHLDDYLASDERRKVVEPVLYPHGRQVTAEERAAQEVLL